MKNLLLTELLEYYNGFSFEDGQVKVYKNYDRNTSKKLACDELFRRADEYRKENLVKEISDELNELISSYYAYVKDKSYHNIYFVDTGISYDVHDLANDIGKQSLAKYKPELITVINKILRITKSLDEIWTNDPNNLRYQSKYPMSRLPQEYYDISGIPLSAIHTRQFYFSYKFSAQIDSFYSIISCRDADIVIYPIFFNRYSSVRFLTEFLTNYNAIRYRNSLMWVLFILDTDDEELKELEYLESEELEDSIKKNNLLFFKQLKFIRIQKINNLWNIDKLLTDIDESVEKYFKIANE